MKFFQKDSPYQPLYHNEVIQEPSIGDVQARGRYSMRIVEHLALSFLVILIAMAPRIPVPLTTDKFVFGSPFSEEPPLEGDVPEPVWDALIPNGLGYFKDGDLAHEISIPTVFHQLHCLYVLRRQYYSQSEELEAFDFGKNRSNHASHCFDYLEQTITCASDTTVEPEDSTNEFLGSGFLRQCRDFEAVKDFVEKWRVFNATGFLAHGLDHGHAHVG